MHWTRHPLRLHRKTWGDEDYAREGLGAELGAAFLSADLGLTLQPREDHAAYLASGIKVLRSDSQAIVSAAAQASAPQLSCTTCSRVCPAS